MNKNVVIVGVGTGAGKVIRSISKNHSCSWTRLIHFDDQCDASPDDDKVKKISTIRRKSIDANSTADDVNDAVAELSGQLRDSELVIIVTCLGHRTGSEYVQAIARNIEQENITAFYFTTLPFNFEGSMQQETARITLENLRGIAETVISVENDLLFNCFPGNTRASDAFGLANTILADGVIGVAELIRCHDLIPIDISKIKTALSRKESSCSFGIGKASGENKCDDVIEELFQSPTLGGIDSIMSANVIISTLIGGQDLSVKDMNHCLGALQARLSASTETITGAHTELDREGEIRVTMITVHYPVEKKPIEKTTVETVHVDSVDDIFGITGRHEVSSQKQPSLPFDEGMSVGIFSEAVATMYNDQNLDIPTFLRRGVQLELEDDE